jgi:hypothetical protein
VGISVFISTYGLKVPGTLLFKLNDSAGKTVVFEVRDTLPLDGDTQVFFPASLGTGEYTAQAVFTPRVPGGILGIWVNTKRPGEYLYTPVRPVDNIRPGFRDRRTGMLVWENASAQPPIYVAPETRQVASWQEGQSRFKALADLRSAAYSEGGACTAAPGGGSAASRVIDMKLEPNRVWARIEAVKPGTVVVANAFMPGWSARIDGTPAGVYRVNGAFQGACLTTAGTHEVTFEYEPPVWRTALVLCGTGVLLFASVGLYRRRVPAPAPDLSPSV